VRSFCDRRGLGRLGVTQRLEKCLARACGFEALDKILCRREINPMLFDQLGARFVSESVPHQPVASSFGCLKLCGSSVRMGRAGL